MTQNTDAHMCAAFEQAWTRVFDSTHPINDQTVDVAAAFPDARILAFGEIHQPDADYSGALYEHSLAQPLDFDGDGNEEILFLQSEDVGWHHLGSDLYLFDSVAAYERANASDAHKYMGRLIVDGRTPIDPAPKHLFHYGRGSIAYVLVKNGRVYTMSFPTAPSDDAPGHVELYRLGINAEPELACGMELLPPIASLRWFSDHSSVFGALTTMYGGGECDLGSMGWTATPANSHLPVIFHRPQTMPALSDLVKDDEAREIRLLVWGLSDPSSWRAYLELKAGRRAFVRDMRAYYHRRLHATGADANDLAERAYRYLIDRIVYARNPDGYSLASVAFSGGPLGITPDTTPGEIARLAVARWMATAEDHATRFPDKLIWRNVALAALRIRLDPLLGELALHAALTGYDADLASTAASPGYINRVRTERQLFLQAALLNALGDERMTAIALDAGAEIDGPANWFGKTALMYAAQDNDARAIRFLLAHGANASAATHKREDYCRALERDARTPLMYAAENASLGVIRQLLNAGADVRAQDTQGHDARWYLDRNAILSGKDKRRVRALFAERN
ncbi:MAG TPA: ankyrin repeat domain-containing protein [Caulobacterales bacterium]|nr:ankyrin repeat domain-containing protein [Caulobacterales bacterium]